MLMLFPSAPFDITRVDDAYADEWTAFQAAGFNCTLFSFEDFEQGVLRIRPTMPTGELLLYRGWMLTAETYARLYEALLTRGVQPITTPQQYRACHYLPEWYPLCIDVTPETVIVPHGDDRTEVLANLDWPGYVVKDYVKSLTTQRGPFASNLQEIEELVAEIEHYRGMLEGGVCIRKFEYLQPDSEERYFVFQGRAYARDGHVPVLVEHIVQRIQSPFFSVDLAKDAHGAYRLIELGDGQVSDRKQWPIDRFVAMFC